MLHERVLSCNKIGSKNWVACAWRYSISLKSLVLCKALESDAIKIGGSEPKAILGFRRFGPQNLDVGRHEGTLKLSPDGNTVTETRKPAASRARALISLMSVVISCCAR